MQWAWLLDRVVQIMPITILIRAILSCLTTAWFSTLSCFCLWICGHAFSWIWRVLYLFISVQHDLYSITSSSGFFFSFLYPKPSTGQNCRISLLCIPAVVTKLIKSLLKVHRTCTKWKIIHWFQVCQNELAPTYYSRTGEEHVFYTKDKISIW